MSDLDQLMETRDQAQLLLDRVNASGLIPPVDAQDDPNIISIAQRRWELRPVDPEKQREAEDIKRRLESRIRIADLAVEALNAAERVRAPMVGTVPTEAAMRRPHYPRSPKAQHRLMVDQLKKTARGARTLADHADRLVADAEAVAASRKGWDSVRGGKLVLAANYLARHDVEAVECRPRVAARNSKELSPEARHWPD